MTDRQTDLLFVLLRSLQTAKRACNLVVCSVDDYEYENYLKIANALVNMINHAERSIEEAKK